MKVENLIVDLQDRIDQAERKIHEFNQARGESWSQLKASLEHAWAEIREGLSRARTSFKQ